MSKILCASFVFSFWIFVVKYKNLTTKGAKVCTKDSKNEECNYERVCYFFINSLTIEIPIKSRTIVEMP